MIITFLGKEYELLPNGTIIYDGFPLGVGSGTTTQITLPSGKLLFCTEKSIFNSFAKLKGWKTETVNYFGNCGANNINQRSGRKIEINGVDATTLPILNEAEYYDFENNSVY